MPHPSERRQELSIDTGDDTEHRAAEDQAAGKGRAAEAKGDPAYSNKMAIEARTRWVVGKWRNPAKFVDQALSSIETRVSWGLQGEGEHESFDQSDLSTSKGNEKIITN